MGISNRILLPCMRLQAGEAQRGLRETLLHMQHQLASMQQQLGQQPQQGEGGDTPSPLYGGQSAGKKPVLEVVRMYDCTRVFDRVVVTVCVFS